MRYNPPMIRFTAIVANLEVRAHARDEEPVIRLAVDSTEGLSEGDLQALASLVYPDGETPPRVRVTVERD